MVFVNAVYFAAKWASDFRKSSTHAAEFTKANGEKMTVDMMARTGTYNHGNIEALDAQVKQQQCSSLQTCPFVIPLVGR